MTTQENWRKWYDGLSRREQMHYHYNRVTFFDDGWFETIDRRLGYPEWMQPVEDFFKSAGCFFLGHDMENGYHHQPKYCIYCPKVEK